MLSQVITLPTKGNRFRIDFVQKVVAVDEASRTVKMLLIPDPRRYEEKEVNGEPGYLDKFDDTFIPLEEIRKLADKMVGKPIYSSPPEIESAPKYVQERIPSIIKYLEESEQVEVKEDLFVVLSFDLVGSTKLSQDLSGQKLSKLIELVMNKITLVVHKFNGYILKYTGDGIIAIFPTPNFIGMNDNAVDCALTLRRLLNDAINPSLLKKSYPELQCRIGLDSGTAAIVSLGDESVQQGNDLIGETINLACKIQSKCEPNEICLGDSVVTNLHTSWRSRLTEKTVDNWNYKNEHGEKYKIFKVD